KMLDELLPTLTTVIDLRSVFERVSEIVRRVIPHDALGLPILTEDRQHVGPWATVGLAPGTFRPIQPLPAGARYLFDQPWEYEIFDDVTRAQAIGATPYSEMPYRSMMRVPVRLQGRIEGALVIFSKAPATYSTADV